MIFWLILITIFLDKVLILLGENWCGSLSGLKGLSAQVFFTSGTGDFSSPVSGIFGRMPKICRPVADTEVSRRTREENPGTQGSVRKRIQDTCHMIMFIYGKLESSICTIWPKFPSTCLLTFITSIRTLLLSYEVCLLFGTVFVCSFPGLFKGCSFPNSWNCKLLSDVSRLS